MGDRRRAGIAGLSAICFLTAPSAPAGAFDCLVNPSAVVKVGSPVSTTIANVDVKRGDRVRAGDPIAELDSRVEAADVALADERARSTAEIDRARSKEDLAERELNRGELLVKTQAVSQQKLDELRSEMHVAQEERFTAELNKRLAELEAQRTRALLEQRTIRSPVTGIVTERLLSPGEYVHQDNQIVVISVNQPLYVEAYLPVRLWSTLHVGDKAQIRIDQPVKRAEQAVVTVVDQVFDSASGTFGVRLELPNADGALPGGMRCRLELPDSAVAGP